MRPGQTTPAADWSHPWQPNKTERPGARGASAPRLLVLGHGDVSHPKEASTLVPGRG